MTRIGIVTGMASEAACVTAATAACAQAERPLLFISGGHSERCFAGASSLVRAGAAALLSFGVAGGLDPALAPGKAVVARAVVRPDGRRLESDARWRERLAGRGRSGVIAGSDGAVATAAAKAALFRASGALTVDMESHEVARAAEAAGVPFLALRVVLDPAARALPSAALAGLGEDGRPRPLKVLAALARKPWELPALLALARDERRALAELRRLAADLGPLFGFGV